MSKENDNIRDLAEQIKNRAKQVQATVLWVVCSEVSGNEMTAKGVSDDVEYHNIILGIGDKITTPKVSSKCLIAVVNGMSSSAYLLDCEEVDTVSLKNSEEDLATLIKELFDAILAMSFTTNYGPTTQLINALTFQELKLRFEKLIV